MKLINNRVYLDYNATSPLADSVKNWIAKGDFSFANPSSIHTSGKRARRLINETKEYLFSIFGLSPQDFHLFFHSGASEGINTLVEGFFFNRFKSRKPADFIFATTDHSCVCKQESDVKALGHDCHILDVDSCGKLKTLPNEIGTHKEKLLNFTWVNNETGVVWSLEEALNLKAQLNCRVHVDAVQAVGKIREWNRLDPTLDAYTFSAHKFGGLRGTGFSFVKKDYIFEPLVRGGDQQEGLRSGTEDTMGIYSIKLALEELLLKQNFDELEKAKNEFESWILELAPPGAIIVGSSGPRALNTTSLLIPGIRSDIALTALDLAGIEASAGSACSSGSVTPSRVLMAMGMSESRSKEVIRFSFSPFLKSEYINEIKEPIKQVMTRLL